MKEYQSNIVTITESEFKRLFTNAQGMSRSDKRKEKETQPHIPAEPNHPEPPKRPESLHTPHWSIDVEGIASIRKYLIQ